MDPVSTIQAALSLAISIKIWLDSREEKEQVIRSISTTTRRLCDVLEPFADTKISANLEGNIISSFNAIRDVLLRTKEHLIAWGGSGKRPKLTSLTGIVIFFAPQQIIKALKQDEQDLNTQLIGMLFILAVNNVLLDAKTKKTRAVEFPEPDAELSLKPLSLAPSRSRSPSPMLIEPAEKQPSGGVSLQDFEVKQFWSDYIGIKVLWASKDAFRSGVEHYLQRSITAAACNRMMFALDEFRLGGVSPVNLDRLASESGSLKGFLSAFEDGERSRSTLSKSSTINQTHLIKKKRERKIETQSSEIRVPLLLWVDDNPQYNVDFIQLATELGIHVVSVTSTSSAKEWIEANSDFLKKNDVASRFRVISDNARIEFDPNEPGATPAQASYNFSAGENIVRFLRGHLFNVPVLIFCAASIPYTRYVETYTGCGSTTSSGIVEEYIKALARGVGNDERWKRFDVW